MNRLPVKWGVIMESLLSPLSWLYGKLFVGHPIAGYFLVLIPAALLLLWVWLMAIDMYESKNLPPNAVPQPSASSTPKSEDGLPSAVSLLRPYAGEFSDVKIIFWSNTHRGFAERLASAFELAGCDVNFTNVPQEMNNPHYFEGIEVRGVNSQLVEVVAEAVTVIGGWDVRTLVTAQIVPRENPKWRYVQQAVRITIGYPKS